MISHEVSVSYYTIATCICKKFCIEIVLPFAPSILISEFFYHMNLLFYIKFYVKDIVICDSVAIMHAIRTIPEFSAYSISPIMLVHIILCVFLRMVN